MKTRLVFTLQDTDSDNSAYRDVKETYEQALEKMMPLNAPSSQLEHRTNMMWTKLDGGQFFCPPQAIAWIEEVQDD